MTSLLKTFAFRTTILRILPLALLSGASMHAQWDSPYGYQGEERTARHHQQHERQDVKEHQREEKYQYGTSWELRQHQKEERHQLKHHQRDERGYGDQYNGYGHQERNRDYNERNYGRPY